MGVAQLLGGADRQRAWRACLAFAVFFAVANLMRLSAMAWSSEVYHLVHGPLGANIFDALQAMAVLAFGDWARRQ